jgi:hypothetical protein
MMSPKEPRTAPTMAPVRFLRSILSSFLGAGSDAETVGTVWRGGGDELMPSEAVGEGDWYEFSSPPPDF